MPRKMFYASLLYSPQVPWRKILISWILMFICYEVSMGRGLGVEINIKFFYIWVRYVTFCFCYRSRSVLLLIDAYFLLPHAQCRTLTICYCMLREP
jgi:hypothetical protein